MIDRLGDCHKPDTVAVGIFQRIDKFAEPTNDDTVFVTLTDEIVMRKHAIKTVRLAETADIGERRSELARIIRRRHLPSVFALHSEIEEILGDIILVRRRHGNPVEMIVDQDVVCRCIDSMTGRNEESRHESQFIGKDLNAVLDQRILLIISQVALVSWTVKFVIGTSAENADVIVTVKSDFVAFFDGLNEFLNQRAIVISRFDESVRDDAPGDFGAA